MDVSGLGKILIVCGIALAFLGVVFTFLPKLPELGGVWGWIGKLPGDVSFKKDHVSFYFPVATCLVISIILTVVFSFLKR